LFPKYYLIFHSEFPKLLLYYSLRVDPLFHKILLAVSLGIIVNSDLSWTDHLNHICLKAYRSLNLIRRTLSTFSPVSFKKRLYISLVRSHLSYCSQLWRPHLIKRHHQHWESRGKLQSSYSTTTIEETTSGDCNHFISCLLCTG